MPLSKEELMWDLMDDGLEDTDLAQNDRLEDMLEMIEDHCLAACLDEGRSYTTVSSVKAMLQLDASHWEEFMEMLRAMRVLGAKVTVTELDDEDELLINWGLLH
jgi:mannitol-1-phosphate/altronate dehydrogenase